MSSCGVANCPCGAACKCGSSCQCENYPDIEFSEQSTTTHTLISGLAPVKGHYDDSEMNFGSENGCKCGSNCSCDPCTCK